MEKSNINKVYKKYFDAMFEGSELRQGDSGEYRGWYGFFIGDNLILGYPTDDSENYWYSNGQYFQNGWDLLNLTIHEFHDELRDYVNSIHPSLRIPLIT